MKYIEIDSEMGKVLHVICDAALKAGGMQIIGSVNYVVSGIKENKTTPLE